MSQVNAVRRAYIDPIRTVMLVDDRFPSYSDLASQSDTLKNGELKPEQLWETQTAERLWSSCRARKWVCDIENKHTDAQIHDRIEKADLIILDYHLDRDNSEPALKLLRHLAESGHSHLVILYTKDPDLKNVRRRIAAYLRGSNDPENSLNGNEKLIEIWESLASEPAIDESVLDDYIVGKKWRRNAKANALIDAFAGDLARDERIALAEATLEKKLREFAGNSTLDTTPIRTSAVDADPSWLAQGNLFVTFVHKEDGSDEGLRVIDAMEKALTDFKPDQLRLTLSYSRYAIQKGGFRFDDKVLKNRTRIAAWWLQLLSGGSKEEELQTLCQRLLDSMTESVLSEVKAFASQTSNIKCPEGTTLPNYARELARLADPSADSDIYHELNEFLCSMPFQETHIRTGTIFCKAEERSALKWAWICVTPSCDMVARSPTESDPWRKELDPVKPMLALRAEVSELKEALLHDATQGHSIFITVDGKRLILKIPHGISKQHRPEMLLLVDQGKTAGGQFEAYQIVNQNQEAAAGAGSNSSPSLKRVTFHSLAQIRKQYASRLLHESGSHLSRIGVDFVNFPKSEDKKK